MQMKTILVVDDSRIMRNIVKNHFSELKMVCRYLEAVNGNEALEMMGNNKIDLVLLDWNMPELNGMEFLKRVRAVDRYSKLPIIMVTSEAARYNVIEALKTGATDYIIKPINGKLFNEKVLKIFKYTEKKSDTIHSPFH
ncbi:MAG: response regulator [Treponema sp.]|nr:response regulator [Treponema sp.]